MATKKSAPKKEPGKKTHRPQTPADRRNAFNKLAGWPQRGQKT